MTDIMDTTGTVAGPTGPMGCEGFEALLPDYLDGSLAPAAAATAEAHRAACAPCAALAGDLEGIRDAAAALPVLEPSRDLWGGIEARIAAPVVPLDESRLAPAGSVTRKADRAIAWPRRPWLAAAAALLLVTGTAGVTYTVTTSRMEQGATLGAAAGEARPGSDAPVALPAFVAAAPEAVGQTSVAPAPSSSAPTASRGSAPSPAGRATGGATATLASDPTAGTALDAAVIYDREIEVMRRMLDQRRAALDTSTVRVLETNLGIIDRAIRESREALMRDPASPLLNRQLTDALDEKLELMRTAVLVSSGST